jgi:hypothetical protein
LRTRFHRLVDRALREIRGVAIGLVTAEAGILSKLAFLAGLSYWFLPVQLIPDRTPYVGYLDNISFLVAGLIAARLLLRPTFLKRVDLPTSGLKLRRDQPVLHRSRRRWGPAMIMARARAAGRRTCWRVPHGVLTTPPSNRTSGAVELTTSKAIASVAVDLPEAAPITTPIPIGRQIIPLHRRIGRRALRTLRPFTAPFLHRLDVRIRSAVDHSDAAETLREMVARINEFSATFYACQTKIAHRSTAPRLECHPQSASPALGMLRPLAAPFLHHLDLRIRSAVDHSAAAETLRGVVVRMNEFSATLQTTFQSQLVNLLLAAFPEKRRLLFVHIPKCAGTDLRENLKSRYPVLDWNLTETSWTDPSRLFALLETLIPQIRASDTVAVHGHVPLGWYFNYALKRPGDRIFAVVRDPMEIVVSYVNYVLTSLLLDPEAIQPDSRDWLQRLRITRVPADPHEDFLAMAAERILLSDISPANCLCHFLGNGNAASAEELIRRSGIEMIDARQYSSWRRQEFGVTSCSQLNESRKFLHLATLTSPQSERVLQLTEEDRILYGKIQGCLTNAPGPIDHVS